MAASRTKTRGSRRVAKQASARAGRAGGSRSRSRATIEARTEGPDLFRFWKPAVGVVLVILAILWVGHMEGVAARKRLQRELRDNPRTAAWFREQKILVDNGQGPDAIWHGRVRRLVESRSPLDGGQSRLIAVELGDVTLLGGGPTDGDQEAVYVRVEGHRFAYRVPGVDERWVVSVTRDAEGHNVIYASVPAGP